MLPNMPLMPARPSPQKMPEARRVLVLHDCEGCGERSTNHHGDEHEAVLLSVKVMGCAED